MPYAIRQQDGEFCVFKSDTDEKLKCYPTKDEAIKYMSALYANEPDKGMTPKEGSTQEVEPQAADTAVHLSSKAIEYANPIPIMDFKSDGNDWEVSGYVSVFNNIDLGKDIVLPGAFTKSLNSGRKVRFLYSHDPRSVLGVPKELKEDNRGLFGRFKISKTRLGEETHQLLQDGAIDSFSFGYSAADYLIGDDDVRQLKGIELYEASLVAMPMNPQAIVTNFKEYLSLVDKITKYIEEFTQLTSEIRGVVVKDHPLTKTKQQEIMELLDTLSGMDAVRSELQSLLTAQPQSLVESHRLTHKLAEFRKRHPELI